MGQQLAGQLARQELAQAYLRRLQRDLQAVPDDVPFERCGRALRPLASFGDREVIHCVYVDRATREFCVHVGMDWPEGAQPALGFFAADTPWAELLEQVARRFADWRHRISAPLYLAEPEPQPERQPPLTPLAGW